MAVKADIEYKGAPLTGITFTVKSAYQKESDEGSFLVYSCEVIMPDGSVQRDTGWEHIKSESPDFNKSPKNDAEVQMKARLVATNATNIVDVEE